MRQDVLGEAAEPRGVRQLAHDRVEVLGVVGLLAGLGGAADGREALERVGRAERQVQAEERIAVARLGVIVTGRPRTGRRLRRRRGVQAHRHFHPDRAEVPMMSLEPAPEPACHHGQHRVVDGRPVGRGRHAVQLLEPGRGEGDLPPRIDVPVERRPQPWLRQLPRGGQQRGQPLMRNRPRARLRRP